MFLFKCLPEMDYLSMPHSLLFAPAQGRHFFTTLPDIVFIFVLVLTMGFGSLVRYVLRDHWDFCVHVHDIVRGSV